MGTEYRAVGESKSPNAGLSSGTQFTDQELIGQIINPRLTRPAMRAAREMLTSETLSTLVTKRESILQGARLSSAKQTRLTAALELADRVARSRNLECVVRSPRDIFELSSDLLLETKEHFVAHYLNTRNALIARETISIGSLNASIVHPREVFEPAIRRKACAVIVVHNHPSGNPEPSEDDIRITRRLREAGEILGIQLLDHVIVGLGGFRSLEEEGYMRS